MTTLTRAPRQNVVPTSKKTDSSQHGLEFLFSPLLEEYYNPAHGHAEDNNNDQAPNASFQEDEFINPFCTRVQEIGGTRDHPLEQVCGNPTMPVQTRRQLATDPEMRNFSFGKTKVWDTSRQTFGKMIIKAKVVMDDKKDEDILYIRTKAGLFAKLDVKETKCTAMSLAEAEYVALSASCAQVMWMRHELQDYGSTSKNTVVLRLSVNHSNIMKPYNIHGTKANPYSGISS
ncbi:hypothetical protein Tco_0065965 [Tanacetum coccineum]